MATVATTSGVARQRLGYHVLIAAIVGATGLLVAIEGLLSAVMLRRTGELMYGEAILYAHAHRLLNGQALYQPLDRLPFTVAAYTPLFYVLAAAGQALAGPGFASGRLLALVCLLLAAGCVGLLAGAERHGVRTGLLAGGLFLALGVPGSGTVPWTSLYKEDSLALALSLGSLVALTRAERRSGGVLAAGVLAGLAILTKQTYVSIALVQLVWLWRRDRAETATFAVGACALVGAVLAGVQWTTGALFDNAIVANVNPAAADQLASNLQILVVLQLGPLIAAGMFLRTRAGRWSPVDGLLVFGCAGAVVQLVALAKVGGTSNHWMAFAALVAVLAARMLHDAAPGAARWVAACGLALALLLVVVPAAGSTWLGEIATLNASAADDVALPILVQRIRATPGEVFADPLDVLVLADREPAFEPLLLQLFSASGRWDTRALVEQMCDGRVELVVLEHPIQLTDWPEPLRAAVAQTMELEGVTAGRLVYRPRSDTRAGCEPGDS